MFLAQLETITKTAHDAADSSDRYVLFVVLGLVAAAGVIVVVALYKAFIKQQDTHATFVTTVYTEGVRGQAELKVVIQDCSECLTRVKSQLEQVQALIEKLQAKSQ